VRAAWPTQPRLPRASAPQIKVNPCRCAATLALASSSAVNSRCQHHTRPKPVPNSTAASVEPSKAAAAVPAIPAAMIGTIASPETSKTSALAWISRVSQRSNDSTAAAVPRAASSPTA